MSIGPSGEQFNLIASEVSVSDAHLQKSLTDLLEQLAALEHKRWAHWQKYVHDHGERQPDGSVRLPANLVERWERQINSPIVTLRKAKRTVIASRYASIFQFWKAGFNKIVKRNSTMSDNFKSFRDPLLSLYQSDVSEVAKKIDDQAVKASSGMRASPRRSATSTFPDLADGERKPIPYVRAATVGPKTIEIKANARLALMGDWGTGASPAMDILKYVAGDSPDVVAHLGDIYYSGTPAECELNFVNPINSILRKDRSLPVYSLSGNHDMYCGGWLLQPDCTTQCCAAS
jgi:hypothetical protein